MLNLSNEENTSTETLFNGRQQDRHRVDTETDEHREARHDYTFSKKSYAISLHGLAHILLWHAVYALYKINQLSGWCVSIGQVITLLGHNFQFHSVA